jgi:ParB/RepB/Spo0J family partition protein
MDENIKYNMQVLPQLQLELDSQQPRTALNSVTGLIRLQKSIEQLGLQQPITVTKIDEGRYKIIDGHRRYLCAKELGIEEIPCAVYDTMSEGELKVRRFALQNVRKQWKPIERSDELYTISKEENLSSFRELAEYTGMSTFTVANSLKLRDQNIHFLNQLAELSEAFHFQFISLMPWLRKIGSTEVPEIIKEILWRIREADLSQGRITNAKELRILKSAFIRFSLNEKMLAEYFNDRAMTTRQLSERISQSGHAADVERVINWYAEKLSTGKSLTTEEANAIDQLVDLRLSDREEAELI